MKIINVLSAITLALAFFMISLVGYWKLHPYKLVEFQNAPFPILNENKIVKNGDRMRYKIDYCKFTKESPRVVKYFVDGVIYEINTVDGILEEGCHQTEMDVYVPKAIPTGVYSVKIVATFKPNPIREIKVVTQTLKFTVIK